MVNEICISMCLRSKAMIRPNDLVDVFILSSSLTILTIIVECERKEERREGKKH